MTTRQRVGSVIVAGLIGAGVLVGCSSQTSDFCDALSSRFDMAGLQRAIDAGDDAETTRQLKDLQDLRDLAPPEIHADAAKVINAAIDTVRAVTEVKGPNGEKMPIDTTKLDETLANVADSAQKLSNYADRSCHVKLRR